MGVAVKEVVKLTVNLPRKVWDVLATVAQEMGVSKTEALRLAISTLAFVHEVESRKGRILIEWPDGKREQVRLLMP